MDKQSHEATASFRLRLLMAEKAPIDKEVSDISNCAAAQTEEEDIYAHSILNRSTYKISWNKIDKIARRRRRSQISKILESNWQIQTPSFKKLTICHPKVDYLSPKS
jgi:hypothetical protein